MQNKTVACYVNMPTCGANGNNEKGGSKGLLEGRLIAYLVETKSCSKGQNEIKV